MDRTRDAAPLPDEGAQVDEHGRPPGVASRTGTGSPQPPADPTRYAEANSRPDDGADARPARRDGAPSGARRAERADD
ncbi:hypothetical protein ACFV7Q_32020 [Streptomyces sp. NPDC059851]|uniref:hypothetical protein n=1 Tax=Streptomyces sp. NPDC059851 TaxID=3346971 RepID=UPI00365D98AC